MGSKNILKNLSNLKYYHHQKENKDNVIFNMQDLEEAIKKHTFLIDELRSADFSLQKLFILGYYNKGNEFNFTFSSKSLLMNILLQSSKDFSYMNLDATYKITENGFPLSVLSTSDRNFHGHPIAFILSSHEKEEAFSYILSNIKNAISKIFDYDWIPKYCLSDFALAIRNSANKLFPNILQIFCRFQFKKNVNNKLRNKKFVPKKFIEWEEVDEFEYSDFFLDSDHRKENIQQIIQSDIDLLMHLYTEIAFDKFWFQNFMIIFLRHISKMINIEAGSNSSRQEFPPQIILLKDLIAELKKN